MTIYNARGGPTKVRYPPTLLADFYKVSHRPQYPNKTEYVYSTWIPRESRIDGIDHVIAFGFQAFIKEYLIEAFDRDFFDRPVNEVCAEYERFIKYTLGEEKPDSTHIRKLHQFGYLPLEIRAVKEGTYVPLRVPMLTVENTHPEFFWLTNFIETLFSCETWQSCTSATLSSKYRGILSKWAEKTGGDLNFIDFQGHDFSMRGMVKVHGAAASGAGHLLSFHGTDTMPAVLFHEYYYNANIEEELVGASIPATEHSVMCAGGADNEFETIKRLITEVYPSGPVSIVCDTWNLWDVLTKTLPALKDEIMARDGTVVVRPDSGNPVDIICGDEWGHTVRARGKEIIKDHPASKGVVQLLWDTFGGTVNEKGYKVLDSHVGMIYGDSITLERCENMCERLAENGFVSTSCVLGIGSYTFQHTTRDTFGFALKSTWVQIAGKEHNIFKDPITDSGMKKSLTGRVHVEKHQYDGLGRLEVTQGLSLDEWIDDLENDLLENDLLEKVYYNGELLVDQNYSDIRARVLEGV
jgi:nicotinamide phosphoribosyltransferase